MWIIEWKKKQKKYVDHLTSSMLNDHIQALGKPRTWGQQQSAMEHHSELKGSWFEFEWCTRLVFGVQLYYKVSGEPWARFKNVQWVDTYIYQRSALYTTFIFSKWK